MEKGQAQTSVVTVRMRADERKQIEAAAQRDALSLSDWIRQGLLAMISRRKVTEQAEGRGIEPPGGRSAGLGM